MLIGTIVLKTLMMVDAKDGYRTEIRLSHMCLCTSFATIAEVTCSISNQEVMYIQELVSNWDFLWQGCVMQCVVSCIWNTTVFTVIGGKNCMENMRGN